mmetsp:Transcript_70130/g.116154  ORF Transcript_70130/g.116154 Transcript_70130/m.116154 type:complete len:268 (+) Transcript_70130:1-804(+)
MEVSPPPPAGGYNPTQPASASQSSDSRPPTGIGLLRPPGPGAPRPPGPNTLRPPGLGFDKKPPADLAALPDDELIRLALENRFGNRSQGSSEEPDAEVETLRRQVKELMEKNEALSKENEEAKGSRDADASKQAKNDLQSTLDALRRRVSCMHARLEDRSVHYEDRSAPRGGRQARRRASSAESLFYEAGDLEPPPAGKAMVMDLTQLRSHDGKAPESDAGSFYGGARRRSLSGDAPLGRNTAYSTASTFMFDLTDCRGTIKPSGDD